MREGAIDHITTEQEKNGEGIVGWMRPLVGESSGCAISVPIGTGEEVSQCWGHGARRGSALVTTLHSHTRYETPDVLVQKLGMIASLKVSRSVVHGKIQKTKLVGTGETLNTKFSVRNQSRALSLLSVRGISVDPLNNLLLPSVVSKVPTGGSAAHKLLK